MFEPAGTGKLAGIDPSIACQRFIPNEGARTILPAGLVMSGNHRGAKQRVPSRLRPWIGPGDGRRLRIGDGARWQEQGKGRKGRADHGLYRYS